MLLGPVVNLALLMVATTLPVTSNMVMVVPAGSVRVQCMVMRLVAGLGVTDRPKLFLFNPFMPPGICVK